MLINSTSSLSRTFLGSTMLQAVSIFASVSSGCGMKRERWCFYRFIGWRWGRPHYNSPSTLNPWFVLDFYKLDIFQNIYRTPSHFPSFVFPLMSFFFCFFFLLFWRLTMWTQICVFSFHFPERDCKQQT
jgi:hypothetical protein